ncbi:hypothetical protein ACYOEI_17075 [Singulisphaera rosea]
MRDADLLRLDGLPFPIGEAEDERLDLERAEVEAHLAQFQPD